MLCFGQDVGFPVGKALALGDFLAEEYGIYLLETFFLNAETGYIVLEFNPVAYPRVLVVRTAQHVEIVAERESYLQDIVLQKLFEEVRYADAVEPEKETCVGCGNLQKGYTVHLSFLERGTGFGVNSHYAAAVEIGYSLAGIVLGVDDDDTAGENHFRHFGYEFLVYCGLVVCHVCPCLAF